MNRSSVGLVPAIAALAAALGLGIPGPASAEFFTIDFNEDGVLQLDGSDDLDFSLCGTTGINSVAGCDGTLPFPDDIFDGLLSGTVKAVDIFSGITAADIDTTFGTVNFATQDVFFFEVEIDSPSAPMDEIGASIVSLNPIANPKGAGYLKMPPSSGAEVPLTATLPLFTGLALFNFDLGNTPTAGNLAAGETSRILFVTYGLGDLLVGQPATFMISSGSNENFTVPIIPEPTTVLLLGAGLAAMGAARRRHLRRGG